jgi:hypothetical protein
MQKPDNWHSMSYDEQREWERNKRELDNARYELEEERERGEREYRHAQATLAKVRQAHREDISCLGDQVDALTEINQLLLDACKAVDAWQNGSPLVGGRGLPPELAEKLRTAIANAEGVPNVA